MCPPRISPQQRGRYAPFRQRNSATHKCVLLTGALLVLAFCGTLLLLRIVLRNHPERGLASRKYFNSEERPRTGFLESDGCQAVCHTKDCLKTASIILDMLDPTVDPCEDFYRYACGGFKKEPTEYMERQLFLKGLEEDVTKFLEDMVNEIPKSVPDNTPGSSLTKIRNFYDSCMDPRSLEENAVTTAFKYLEYFGIKNWPDLHDDYSFNEPDLDESLIRLFMYNELPLFSINILYVPLINQTGSETVSEDPADYEKKAQLVFRRYPIFYYDGFVDESYVGPIEATMEYFVQNDTDSDRILDDVFAFDLAISNITEKATKRNEECSTNDTKSCSDYRYNCSQEGNQHMDRWCKITKEILDRSGFSKKYPAMPIILEDGEYFQELGQLIDVTNQRTIAHALAIQFLVTNAFAMNFALRRKATVSNMYVHKKYFSEMNEYRSPFCAMWTCFRLPILAGTAFYSSKYNNSNLRKEINDLYLDLKEITVSAVRDIPWIDLEAKQGLEELFSKIRFAAEDYLEYVNNMTAVDEFHKELQITGESFLANDLEVRKFASILYLLNMDNATKLVELQNFPFVFNPMYNFRTLTIVFEFGTFLFPLISTTRPRYANLGFLGVVMGHELGHPVEIFLREYENKSEIFSNVYEERKKCIEDHFSEYEIDGTGEKVQGNITFHENIADYLGTRAAFKSLKKYQEKYGVDAMLPGLHFNNEQMLFIIAAQDWCETNTLKSLKLYLDDNHSPANVRIWETYKNFEAFSEAFSCPVGRPMNPARKCSFE